MIHVQNLVKKFGEFTAVDHVSFDVRPGGKSGGCPAAVRYRLPRTRASTPISRRTRTWGSTPSFIMCRAARIEILLKLFELWERRNDQVKTFSGGRQRVGRI
jgi:ABC-2 type transport system ATP-binding protein